VVLVDSSIWIEAARREGDIGAKVALESLLEEYEAALCSPVRLEVLGGARKEDQKKWVAGFAVIPYVQITESTWNLAVENAWRLRDSGTQVPWKDVLVASASIEQHCRVFSRDKHFNVMAQILGVRLYEPGYGGSFAPDEAT
jgi:hypothetical protein